MNVVSTQIAGIVAIVTAAMGNFTGGFSDTLASINTQFAGSSQNATAATASGAGAISPTPSNGEVSSTSIYLAINEYRARHGLAPVASNSQLQNIAQNWADHMSRTGVPAHNPNYLGQYPAGWHEGGENVHQNWRGASTQEVIQAWHNSESHRLNQADPNFDEVGVGVAYSADGRMWVVTDYMR